MFEIDVSQVTSLVSQMMIVIGVLTGLTNLIVQIAKGVTYDKIPTNILAVVVAMLLTLAATVVYVSVYAVAVTPTLIIGALILGVLVSYAAMFGFDKLKAAIEQMIGNAG